MTTAESEDILNDLNRYCFRLEDSYAETTEALEISVRKVAALFSHVTELESELVEKTFVLECLQQRNDLLQNRILSKPDDLSSENKSLKREIHRLASIIDGQNLQLQEKSAELLLSQKKRDKLQEVVNAQMEKLLELQRECDASVHVPKPINESSLVEELLGRLKEEASCRSRLESQIEQLKQMCAEHERDASDAHRKLKETQNILDAYLHRY
ncbi:hypothetical protein RCL1_002202 [Eukaryota sp. TZLM3-RCL]